ncbi:MAG: type I-U CRISPR-associated protein Cas7 [Gammaproteobacteria bacterium]|nr:type I-U CRISPR-associated protein Cas7 [Gammaproteobacteria bacterium]
MEIELTYECLRESVQNSEAALRCRTRLQPAGGEGDKVFPPTYAGAAYATEKRRIEGYAEPVECVLLDSVQSQANRIEEALQDAVDEGRLELPVIEVDFSEVAILEPGDDGPGLYEPIGRVTSLQAPHRAADAILRDSELDGQPFRQTEIGKKIGLANLRNATPLFEICPTALLLGLWDSTGPKGGLGTKFQRALVSEIIGVDACYGTKSESRIDPLGIRKDAAELYETSDGGWCLDPAAAVKEKSKPKRKGKDGKPSEANHGNIVPSLSKIRDGVPVAGGATIAYAQQITVLSLPALRRLQFPLDGRVSAAANVAGRTVVAALGVCGAVLAAQRGLDLRSRCLLWPQAPLRWELLSAPSEAPGEFTLSGDEAIELLSQAVAAAAQCGLTWQSQGLVLKPADKLLELVRKSQQLAIVSGASEGGE